MYGLVVKTTEYACGWVQLNTGEQHLHIAAADGAPGFDDLVYDITTHFGADGVPAKAVVMDDWNSDWDTLYPFSAVRLEYSISMGQTC
jgi:hypothetical protein